MHHSETPLFRFAVSLALFALVVTGCQTSPPTRASDAREPDPASGDAFSRGQAAEDGRAGDRENGTEWQGAQNSRTSGGAGRSASKSSGESDADKEVILKSDQLEVTKTVRAESPVGGSTRYRIHLRARETVNNVRIVETMPDGVRFESADPSASIQGRDASWRFRSLDKNETRTIEVTVTPEDEGDYEIWSSVTVENRFRIGLFAGRPNLRVNKEGPSTVELGEEAVWEVTVTNTGSAAATGIVVSDTLPDAFSPENDLRREIGTLATDESETVEFRATAVEKGQFRNRAVASYDGSGPGGEGGGGRSSSSGIPISVVQSGLRVSLEGPEEAYVFKPETYEILVENTGDTDLSDVRITNRLPGDASVTDNAGGRVRDNAIGWMIPDLPAGAARSISPEITLTRKGTATNRVRAVAAEGPEDSASVTAEWLAVPGVTISLEDEKDPIRVRETTEYTIKVRNQGEFEPVSGTVEVRFNDSLRPLSVEGDARGTIDGQTVTFPRTTLKPGRNTTLTITAEGTAVGPGRAVLEFTAEFLADPIVSEEATNVY